MSILLQKLPSLAEDENWRKKHIAHYDNTIKAISASNAWYTSYDEGFRKKAARLLILDGISHEPAPSQLCSTIQDIYQLAGLILGDVLCEVMGFEWCRSNLFPDEPLQVYHHSGFILHLPALILNSEKPPYLRNDGLSSLVSDILHNQLSAYIVEYHWLLYTCNVWEDWSEAKHIEKFGICPPPSIQKITRLMYQLDENLLIEQLKTTNILPSKKILRQNDWSQLETQYQQIAKKYEEKFGEDWQQKAENFTDFDLFNI